jgi:hypothetical protein
MSQPNDSTAAFLYWTCIQILTWTSVILTEVSLNHSNIYADTNPSQAKTSPFRVVSTSALSKYIASYNLNY